MTPLYLAREDEPAVLRERVVDLSESVASAGLLGILSSGNVSYLHRPSSQMAITGKGSSLSDISREMVCVVNISDHLLDGPPPSTEWLLHEECYEVGEWSFCVHLHSTWITAMAAIDLEYMPRVTYYQYLVGDPIPFTKFEIPGSAHLSSDVSASLSSHDTNAVMMSNHGAIVMGDTAEQVLKRCIILEDTCRIAALSLTSQRVISAHRAVKEDINRMFERYAS